MAQEQRQQINKTRINPVETGVIQSDVASSTQMATIAPTKSKGMRMAEMFNLGVKTATAIVPKYEGQQKEEAAARIAKEKYEWIDTINTFETDTEKAKWIQDKIAEVSNPKVEGYYREGVIGSLSSLYATYAKGAKEESYKANKGLYSDMALANLQTTGKIDKSILDGHFKTDVKNADKLPAIVAGVESYLAFEAQAIRTPEDLAAYKQKVSEVTKELNSDSFLFGSKGVEAQNLKTKFLKATQTITNTFNTQFKDSFNATIAQQEVDLQNTPDSFSKQLDSGVKSGYIKEAEAIKKKATYMKKYTEFQDLETFKNSEFSASNQSNNVNYDTWSADKKKFAKDKVNENLDNDLNNGMYNSFALIAARNTYVGEERMSNTFGNWKSDTPEVITKNLTLFNNLKDVEHGGKALSLMKPDTLAFYSLMSANPNFDIPTLQDAIHQTSGQSVRWSDGSSMDAAENKKKWNKNVISKLPLKEKNVAERLLRVYSNLMDPADAIKMVEKNYINLNTKKDNDMTFRGFGDIDTSYIENGLKDYVLKDSGLDFDKLHVVLDGGKMQIRDVENPLMPVVDMEYSEFVTALAVLKVAEETVQQQEKKVQVEKKLEEVKTLTNSMANPYYDDGKSTLEHLQEFDKKAGEWVNKNVPGIGALNRWIELLKPRQEDK